MPDSTHGSRSSRPLWLLVALLLGVSIVVPLWVPLYDQDEPALIGFPFFYWFQFLMVPIASLLTYAAFRLSQSATARDHRSGGEQPRSTGRGES